MIKFVLSLSCDNIINNQQLIEQNEYNNLFWGIESSLPFSIFNGRANNNQWGNFIDYYTMVNWVKSYEEISNNLVMFDFGNILLDEKDFENCFGAMVFNEFANQSNVYFEIADIKLIDFLINKYPNIQISLHENYTIFHDEDTITNLINTYPNNIKAINITVLNLCENINIQKMGVLNLESCFYCPQFPLCLQNEQQNILRFRKKSIFNECNKKKFLDQKSLTNTIKTLLNFTDTIMFQSIAYGQVNEYMEIIKSVLEQEQEGLI